MSSIASHARRTSRVARRRLVRVDEAVAASISEAGQLQPQLRRLMDGLEQVLVAVHDLRGSSSAATGVRRCAGIARSRLPPSREHRRAAIVTISHGSAPRLRSRPATAPGGGCAGWRGSPGDRRGSRGCRLPPWASAICRLSTSPMPEPPGLVVKNGTKRFARVREPRAFVFHPQLHGRRRRSAAGAASRRGRRRRFRGRHRRRCESG